jgi:hypothetical protein
VREKLLQRYPWGVLRIDHSRSLLQAGRETLPGRRLWRGVRWAVLQAGHDMLLHRDKRELLRRQSQVCERQLQMSDRYDDVWRACCTNSEDCSDGKCCPKGKVNCGGECWPADTGIVPT